MDNKELLEILDQRFNKIDEKHQNLVITPTWDLSFCCLSFRTLKIVEMTKIVMCTPFSQISD